MVSPYVNAGIPTYLRKAQNDPQKLIDEANKLSHEYSPKFPEDRLAYEVGLLRSHIRRLMEEIQDLKKERGK